MQKNMIGFTLLVCLFGTFSFADKANKKNTTAAYTEMIILDKGIKRTIRVPKTAEQKSSVGTLSMKEEVLSKKGIVVAFKKSSKIDISELERKYGLKLKKKLVIGYYIFENVSQKDDAEIVSSIIKNEKNLKTVKPNWKKNNQPR